MARGDRRRDRGDPVITRLRARAARHGVTRDTLRMSAALAAVTTPILALYGRAGGAW